MPHPVREYVRRISVQDLEDYPDWDISKAIPRLPVPDLRSTLELYLKLVAPVVSADDLEHTTRVVNEFGVQGGIGEHLQRELIKISGEKNNWVNKWWLQDMYMKNTLALPVNSSPGMVFPRQHFGSEREQLRFAAQLISGIIDYKTILDARGLPVDRARHSKKGQPMCMEQYYRLFSSYRYPGRDQDKLVTNIQKEDPFDPEYIIVAARDQFYSLVVVSNGTRLSEEDLYNQLRRIVKLAEEETREEPIGILTALPRDKWAEVHQHMGEIGENKANFELIENCIFILCLDKPVHLSHSGEGSQQHRDDISLALQMLHGMGSKHNAANRWYDKTMQFVISKDGNCGLNYEHSVAEGIAVIRLIEHILQYMEEMKARRLMRCPSICDLAFPHKLHWKVDDFTKSKIVEAKHEIDSLAENLDLNILRFQKFGRDFPKTVNMSPDSFIQLALQLAHYKIHGFLVHTYESASIRRFYQGRVDNIRAASLPALEWCRAMQGEGDHSIDDKIRLLRRALDWQTDVMLHTILGKGVDNHLLGLRETAVELDLPVPEMFKDTSYLESNQFRLSTSQVPTSMDTFICYGAVVPNGYGAAYNPHPDYIVVAISCWLNHPEIRADRFAEALEESFCAMHELISANTDLAKMELDYTESKIPEEAPIKAGRSSPPTNNGETSASASAKV